jgi:phosphoribosylformylglycinamidine synthase
VNIPTGKDSLSMKQKYPTEEVIAPGTPAAGNCIDIQKVVEPVLQRDGAQSITSNHDEFKLGGSSFAQTLNTIGKDAPTIKDAAFQKSPKYTRINFRR